MTAGRHIRDSRRTAILGGVSPFSEIGHPTDPTKVALLWVVNSAARPPVHTLEAGQKVDPCHGNQCDAAQASHAFDDEANLRWCVVETVGCHLVDARIDFRDANIVNGERGIEHVAERQFFTTESSISREPFERMPLCLLARLSACSLNSRVILKL